MKRKLLTTVIALLVSLGGLTGQVAQADKEKSNHHAKKENAWIGKWDKLDQSIWPALTVAAKIFHTDESTLKTVVGREGGDISPAILHESLCNGYVGSNRYGNGWNHSGSNAFGAGQFMMDNHSPCDTQTAWGTFGAYDDTAFQEAKSLGYPIPYRFKNPASNVGQAITMAYMIAHGGLYVHWCASMC